jgi:hypothetical protein
VIRYLFALALLAAAVLCAWRWGGGPERAVAAVLVGMAVVDPLAHAMMGTLGAYDAVNTIHFLIDAAALAALVAIALKADRLWTLWAASAQLLMALSHVLRILAIPMEERVYAAISRAPSYVLIALLITGVLLHKRRRDRVLRNSPDF